MPRGDGTGPMGIGPMTGGGRGFCSPWGVGAALHGQGFPHWRGYAYSYYQPRPSFLGLMLFTPWTSREQEIGFLKNKAEILREQLREMEARIGQLSTEKE
jgi:hypothetical protein